MLATSSGEAVTDIKFEVQLLIKLQISLKRAYQKVIQHYIYK